MAIETAEALERLGDIADLVLTHDRPIVRPVDDSVAREDDGAVAAAAPGPRLRSRSPCARLPASRGSTTAGTDPCILAVGGHLKNTISLRIGQDVVVGSHVGDLDNTLSMQVLSPGHHGPD